MADKLRVGFIGVGLMGHGAAKNILERGAYPLTIIGNRNREPVDDLVKRGAREAANPAEVAAASDVVILCLPSSVEVEPALASISIAGNSPIGSGMPPGCCARWST